MNMPLVTIIIATFNSGKLLPRTLAAIRDQDYPQDRLEILAIDGGSSDDTADVVRRYGGKIIKNPETEPVNAKVIGIQQARGKYVITLDHDEVLLNPHSIRMKILALEENPDCKAALCSGYKRPRNYPLLNEYISEYGDPYSLFIYNFPKGYGFFEKALRKNYSIVKSEEDYFVVSFAKAKNQPLIELVCAATVIDRAYFEESCSTKNGVGHAFYAMLQSGDNKIIVSRKDPVEHYSVDALRSYWPKLKWRVINNVFATRDNSAGFAGRMAYQPSLKYKKFLFLPYSFLIIIPLLHGALMAGSRKNPVYLLHPLFCLYVSVQILFQYSKKMLGMSPVYTSYDGKKKIK